MENKGWVPWPVDSYRASTRIGNSDQADTGVYVAANLLLDLRQTV